MHRQRGIGTVPAVLIAAGLGMVTAVFLMDWMVVDVRTTGEDAVHLVLPLPLAAGRVAAAMVPQEAVEDVRIPPEVEAYRGQVVAALDTLRSLPDGTELVRVEEPGTLVVIAVEDEALRLAVDDHGTTVRCTLPLAGLQRALEEWDGQTFEPGLIFDVLAAAPNGDLVRVEEPDGTRVAISMW